MGFSAGEVALAHALARFPREEAGARVGASGAAAAWAAAAREVAARGGLRAEAVPAREVRLSEVGGLEEAKRALGESILLSRDKAVRLPPPASRPEAGRPATLTRTGGRGAPPPLPLLPSPPRTIWTRLVPPSVLTGHVSRAGHAAGARGTACARDAAAWPAGHWQDNARARRRVRGAWPAPRPAGCARSSWLIVRGAVD
jgi:hypothetical protein